MVSVVTVQDDVRVDGLALIITTSFISKGLWNKLGVPEPP